MRSILWCFYFCSSADIPKIKPIANVNVNQGTNATLQCVVDGEPAPISVQWFFNNTGPIANSADHAINAVTTTFAYHTGVTSDLTIYDVQRLSDVGLYTCKASNTVGQSEESANLTVACKKMFFFFSRFNYFYYVYFFHEANIINKSRSLSQANKSASHQILRNIYSTCFHCTILLWQLRNTIDDRIQI